MARGIEKLTESKIEKARDGDFISDGKGLYLQVRGQSKSWVFQYVDADGKVRNMGLGPVHTVSLEQAREKAKEYRSQRKAGVDPYDAREKAEKQAEEARKLAAEKDKTFRAAAEAWMATNHVPGGWSDERAKFIRDSLLTKHVFPQIGDRPIKQFDIREDKTGLHLVVDVLKPLWGKKHETGKQVRKCLEEILYFAMGHSWFATGPNAADIKGQLKSQLAKVNYVPKRHPALPHQRSPEFMKRVRDYRDAGNRKVKTDGPVVKSDRCKICQSSQLEEINAAKRAGLTITQLAAKFGIGWNTVFHHYAKHDPEFVDLNTTRREKGILAIEFGMLTAVRKGQARAAKWSEIDLEDGIWICKEHKTKKKTGQNYCVPLSKQAIGLLETMLAYKEASGTQSDYVFPGSKGGKNPLSRTACNKLIRKLGYSKEEMSVHGMRTMFGEWCEEETDYEEKDSEIALGHTIGGTTRNAYKRNAPRIEKRRPMMQDWADYCDPPLPSEEKGKLIDAAQEVPSQEVGGSEMRRPRI